MQTVRTIDELQARAARTLVDHSQNSGICRCGYGYGFDPTTTWSQHTAVTLFRVTPKEVTRC